MLVVGFHTISEALAVEKASKEGKLPGRLGPVPREVKAGCGYAWLAEDSERAELERALEEQNLAYEAIFVLQ